MSAAASTPSDDREAFARLLTDLRPKLHRYCARMTGSAIHGEDVLQDAALRALEAFTQSAPIHNPEGWLFRIAHNAALDFLRRQARSQRLAVDEDPDMVAGAEETDRRQLAAASLSTFMWLPPSQRSSVILMDVLGYSLEEIGDVTSLSIPAIKAALHRGRTRLRELAGQADELPLPVLAEAERARLQLYVNRFNARDFDAVRDMLADDVRLDLVNRMQRAGKRQVANYFTNYDGIAGWRFAPGLVEGRPGALVYDDAAGADRPGYFVLLDWSGDRILKIRDFRYASYVFAEAEFVALP
ncbi:sigma-70 family RNA polymerase sigma factor [Bradyrhizobium sp. LHD-71]|uniref:RNA polymerase sigma factor n=1 Tax=Bradyrhizobium sp. LHD-71 TaxID=3072141 RepID=UPI00280CDAB9|nr:sigma-70 family RNA polymerase sigma factor [Bradyrhizobium sp. LHD-71]MDQ8729095.1 sigma-70 family RNA polymerase sigma factor [Bradyrhizobium sp. LHD-71]